MNRENVVPFVSSARGALARRGAPDKTRRMPALVDVECPRCAAVLCVDAASLLANPEILCAGCDGTFSLEWGEAAAD